jgi:hypothetical protein
MRVRPKLGLFRLRRQSPAHPKMNVEPVRVVERKDDLLSASRKVFDAPPDEVRREIQLTRPQNVATVQSHARDRLSNDVRREADHHRLNFR